MDPEPIRIVRGGDLGPDACEAIQRLAADVYRAAIVVPVATLLAWQRVNAGIFWLALDGERTVGYVSALPLSPEAFARTLDPRFEEARVVVPGAIVDYRRPGERSVFFSSIVVHPDWRGRSGASRLLRMAFLEDLAALRNRGVRVSALSSEVVSPAGERAMRSLGMGPLLETLQGSRIFHCATHPAALAARAAAIRARLDVGDA